MGWATLQCSPSSGGATVILPILFGGPRPVSAPVISEECWLVRYNTISLGNREDRCLLSYATILR